MGLSPSFEDVRRLLSPRAPCLVKVLGDESSHLGKELAGQVLTQLRNRGVLEVIS